jgi:hypothetical protein
LKCVTPKGQTLKTDFEALLALDIDAVIAAHGALIESRAKELLKTEISNVFT